MEPLLVHPDPPPPELAQALDLGGYPWKGVAAEADIAGAEPDDGWSGAIVLVDRDPDTAFAVCRALRKADVPLENLVGAAADLDVGTVAVEGLIVLRNMRRLLERPVTVIASARPLI